MSPSQAKVIYTVLVPGAFELTNLTGRAAYQNGTWKVGVGSFCGVLALENGKKKSSLPAACKSAA